MKCENCGCEKEGLLQCSRCKSTYYCNVDCQRENWKQHKLECKKKREIVNEDSNNNSNSSGRCPYRPRNGSSSSSSLSGGVCPFRDMKEESELKKIIDANLQRGIEGIYELGGLAKSGEMSMQIPLRKSVVKVLKIIESLNLSDEEGVPNEYLNGLALFIANMLQWEHNEDIKEDNFETLFSYSFFVILHRQELCGYCFGRILFWLNGHNSQRFREMLKSQEDSEYVVRFIQISLVSDEWGLFRNKHLWDNFLVTLGNILNNS